MTYVEAVVYWTAIPGLTGLLSSDLVELLKYCFLWL